MDINEIYRKIKDPYVRILHQEKNLTDHSWLKILDNPRTILGQTIQLLETAKSSTLPRVYIKRYNLDPSDIAYESIGAHANLGSALVDRAIMNICDGYPSYAKLGYSYRQIMQAFRRHDLPENVIGDQPDDGTRDDKALAVKEHRYFKAYSQLSPKNENEDEGKIRQLLKEMEEKSSDIGRLLHCSDKTIAIITSLCYDLFGKSPKLAKNAPNVSEIDIKNMSFCDYHDGNLYKASEMWTVGFFKTRQTFIYDDYGFFTAILIMATLLINGTWYAWREKDYEEYSLKSPRFS